MIHFVDITIPVEMARRHAIQTDPRTAGDPGYVVKAALAECFGHGTVRPWRFLRDEGVHRIVGIVEDPKAVKPNAASRRLGIVSEAIDYVFGEDETLILDVVATPVKRITVRDGNRNRLQSLFRCITTTRVDTEDGVAYRSSRDHAVKAAAYARWLVEQVGREGGGFEVIDVPDILSTRPVTHNRKRSGEVGVIATPCVHGKVPVRIVDVDAAMAFLRQGLKKGKDLGLGALIPTTVLEEVV